MSCSALQSTFPSRTTSHSSTTIFTVHLALFADHIHTTPRKPSPTPGAFGAQVSDNIRRDVINPYLLTWCIWRRSSHPCILLRTGSHADRKSRGPEVTRTGSHADRKSRGPEVTRTGSHADRKSRRPEVTRTGSHADRKSRGPEVTRTGSHADRKSRGPEVTRTGSHVDRHTPPHDASVRGISWRAPAGINVRQYCSKKYKRLFRAVPGSGRFQLTNLLGFS